MANKMLIDASHPEETRVVVLRGNKVQEFDFEAADKMPLRGNIYLAKVTRVEPSLQAAFVDYGGNRHGFLAFAEIHPDYYQIPVADRLALLEEENRAHRQATRKKNIVPSRRAAAGARGAATVTTARKSAPRMTTASSLDRRRAATMTPEGPSRTQTLKASKCSRSRLLEKNREASRRVTPKDSRPKREISKRLLSRA